MAAAQSQWVLNTLYFATDPFAMDMTGQMMIMAKRKEMGIDVNEHPRFTDYLRYAERLGLGVTNPAKLNVVKKQLEEQDAKPKESGGKK